MRYKLKLFNQNSCITHFFQRDNFSEISCLVSLNEYPLEWPIADIGRSAAYERASYSMKVLSMPEFCMRPKYIS
jgi:hypothetical protein